MLAVIRRWLWLSVVAVLVAGCSGGGSHSSAKPTAGWVRSDLKPVTQPELAGGLVVLYVAAGGGLQVVALDPKTGRTLWHDRASPGSTTPGVAPVLGVAGSTVAFLSPVDDSTYSRLVGVAAATGRQLWHTPAGLFEDWPQPCPGDTLDICTTGSFGLAQQTQALRFRASNGAPAGAVLVSQSPGGRALGPDLFDPGVRNPEMLLSVSGASVAWTRTLASVFPAPGLSTDHGWQFDRVPAAGLFVGSVDGPPLRSTGSSGTIDLSRAMTAGFRIPDGTAVWRDAGAIYACGVLPCPREAEDSSAYQPPTTGVRLRATGTANLNLSPVVTVSPSPGADVVVEGFDLATGKTLWSYDAGADGLLLFQTPPLLGPHEVVLPAPGGGTVALDLASGAHSPVPPGSSGPSGGAGWCVSTITYKTQVGYQTPNSTPGDYVRIGQEAIGPCEASGVSAAAIPRTVPGFVGTVIGGLTVWSESSKVAAAPTSP